MRRKNKNQKLVIILMVLVALISVGYAAISTNLQINGLTTIQKQTWDVHFENVNLKEGSVNVTPQITSPTIVEYSVELDKPGDYHEFIVDVVNGGTIDAMIDNIDVKPVLTTDQKKYLDFSVTYENGNVISSKQLLSKGETKKVKVSLKYKDDITSKDLPSDNTELDIKIKVNYVQADDSAVEVHDKNYLMIVDTTNSDAIPAFGGPILKNQVEKIYTLDSITVPENAIASWDVSELKNESVMAYTLDDDNDGMYELYLGQEDGVIANPNSKSLFNFYTAVDTIDLSNFDTSNVTNMRNMFQKCYKLVDLNVSNFDTSKVTTMFAMFTCCSSLTNLNVSNFDTSNVTDMAYMFDRCSSLSNVNLSSFNTSNVTDMACMFGGCSSLSNVNLSSFNTSNVTDMYGMFSGSTSLSNLIGLENWDTSNVTDMSTMFSGSSYVGDGKLTNESLAGIKNWNVSKVTDFTCMFYGQGTNLTSLDLSKWDTSSAESFNHMFCDNFKLTSLDLSGWNVSKVKTMYDMFDDCYALKTIGDISHWNTASLLDAGGMFNGCTSFVGDNGTLDLSGWNTSNLMAVGEMFRATKLTTIDLSGWNTTKVTNSTWDGAGSSYIFYESGNTSSLKGFAQMFYNCSNLQNVYVGLKWVINDGVSTTNMFTGAGVSSVTLK